LDISDSARLEAIEIVAPVNAAIFATQRQLQMG
jgi:hypothetical protein